MTPEAASSKSAELTDLLQLSSNAAWKNVVEPALVKARDEHLSASTAKGSTPTARAEHIHAYHLAKDLLELVPDKIRKHRAAIAAFQTAGGESTFKMGDAEALH